MGHRTREKSKTKGGRENSRVLRLEKAAFFSSSDPRCSYLGRDGQYKTTISEVDS